MFIRVIRGSEISAARLVSTITIDLDRFTRALAGCAAILTTRLRRAGAGRILTLVLVIVGHFDPPLCVCVSEK